MTSPAISIQAAEPVPEQNGLIHGVSAEELQALANTCFEAKTKAYCELNSDEA